MKHFIEEYGFAILIVVVVISLICIATPIGMVIKTQISDVVEGLGGKTNSNFNNIKVDTEAMSDKKKTDKEDESVWNKDFEISITADKDNPDAGNSIEFEITISNTGTKDLKNINLVSELTGDEWNLEELKASEKQSFTASYTVLESDIEVGKIILVAKASSEGITKEKSLELETAEVTAHLSIEVKGDSKPANEMAYIPGETITFKVSVLNDGNVTVENIILVGNGNEYSIEKIVPGEIKYFTSTYIVTEADGNTGHIVMEFTATGEYDGEEVDVTPGTSNEPTQPAEITPPSSPLPAEAN